MGAGDKLLIIAVDDELDTRVLYQYFFKPEVESGRVELHFTTNASECLKILADSNLINSVVLLDINMPQISGFDILEDIKRTSEKTKVIMVSAYSMSDYVEKSKSLGASAYVEKPVDFEKLKEKIFTMIGN